MRRKEKEKGKQTAEGKAMNIRISEQPERIYLGMRGVWQVHFPELKRTK
jgi:hypothetical protein